MTEFSVPRKPPRFMKIFTLTFYEIVNNFVIKNFGEMTQWPNRFPDSG